MNRLASWTNSWGGRECVCVVGLYANQHRRLQVIHTKNQENLNFRARGEREQAQQIRRQPEFGQIKIPSEI